MKKLCCILWCSIVWISCKPSIPKDVIEPRKMEKVLYDFHIVDGYLSTIYNQDSSKKVAAAYYEGIYKKFGIDSALYAKSIKYYYTNPAELEKMYKHITKKLDFQKGVMNKVDSSQNPKTKVLPVVK